MQKERQTLKVAKLLPNNGQLAWLPINPRQWTMSDVEKTANSLTNDPDFLEDRPPLAIPFEDRFVVFAGNLRLTAAMKLKLKELPVVIYTPENETDQMTIKRRAILDNGSFGAWDFDALANERDDLPLGDWGVPAWKAPDDLPDFSGVNDDDDNNYSRKIEVPSYEPSSTNPALSECFDTKKRNELVKEIEAAAVPDEVKAFLVAAAGRHIVFHYDKIADYYAHAPKEVQELMEHSALVIIDMGGAIDNGFVKLAKKIAAQYEQDYGSEE